MLLQSKNRPYELLLSNIGTNGVEISKLRMVERWRQHNGLVMPFGEERPVLEHHAHVYEIVDIAIGVVCLKFGKRAKGDNIHYWHHLLQNMSQPHGRKYILVNNSDGWSVGVHHYGG